MTMPARGSAPPPPALPWIGTDPRGFTVILTASTWSHASPHVVHFPHPAPLHAATVALSSPDMVIDNIPRRFGPARKGEERYIRQDSYTGEYITIPVMILPAAQTHEGVSVPAGARLALSFYVDRAIPPGTKLWP